MLLFWFLLSQLMQTGVYFESVVYPNPFLFADHPYAIVVSEATARDSEWRKVIRAMKEKYNCRSTFRNKFVSL